MQQMEVESDVDGFSRMQRSETSYPTNNYYC